MTGRRVKDFIQDISGQFNWMSIASGDLTDEEFMLLEQQATQADLSVDDIMHEVAKWNGKPLPKSERYSMRQTPSRRKAANIRNRRSRYEPAQASRNRVKRASNIVRVQEYTLDPIDKQRAEELGVTIEVESYDGDEFEVQLVGEPQDIYELLVDAGAFMWNSFDEFINYGGRGDAHRIGSYRASRSRRSRYQPAPASRFNRRAGILGGDDLEGWLVNIDMNNVDITEVTGAIAEYVGENQVRRWAIGEDDGGEYPYEVDEALDLVRDIFMYSSIPGLVRNELRDRFGKTSNFRRNKRASLTLALSDITWIAREREPGFFWVVGTDSEGYHYEQGLVPASSAREAIEEMEMGHQYSLRQSNRARRANRNATTTEIERRAQGHTASRAQLNNRKATNMNRDYRPRNASRYDRPGYAPRGRYRADAEMERLRRARAASRRRARGFAGADRAAARRKTAQELYRTSLDILYPEDIPNIEADYGVIAVQTGVGYHNQEAIFEGTREALLQMLKDNHVGPEFTGDPEEDWLEKVSSNTNEKDTNMNRGRRARMANRARIAKESALERSVAQLNLAVRRLAAIQAKIDKDPLEDVSKDIENVEEPVEEPEEIRLNAESLNEQPESAEDAKEEESDDNNSVVDSEVVAKRPIRMASRPSSDDFDLF